MGTAVEAVQERIAAEEQLAAIEYARRAREYAAKAWACEYAATNWVAAQFDAGIVEAAIAIGKDDLDERDLYEGADWLLKRGKKVAQARVKDAREAVKAVGSRNQLRLAIALAA